MDSGQQEKLREPRGEQMNVPPDPREEKAAKN